MSIESRSAYAVGLVTVESPPVLQTLKNFWQDYYPQLQLVKDNPAQHPLLDSTFSLENLENLFGMSQLRKEFADMHATGSSQKKSLSKRGKRESRLNHSPSEEKLTVTLTNKAKDKVVIISYQKFLADSRKDSIKIDYAYQGETEYDLELVTYLDNSYELNASGFPLSDKPKVTVRSIFGHKAVSGETLPPKVNIS